MYDFLNDVRVLDLTRLLPGPVCTHHLNEFGAEVIKIEDVNSGDYARDFSTKSSNLWPVFYTINRNKKKIAINLKTTIGKEIFFKLLEKSHVVVESFRPGVMKKLGIDFDACKKINKTIVYCSISGYGQNGPLSNKSGHDINYLGYAGLLSQIGNKDDLCLPNFQIADLFGGAIYPAFSIASALYKNKNKKQPVFLDISMTDVVYTHNFHGLSNMIEGIDKNSKPEKDLLNGREACYNIYKTKDNRYFALGALEFKFWREFCKVIKREDLVAQHWSFKKSNASIAKREVKKVFLKKTFKEWINIFKKTDCCATPIFDFKETIFDQQIKHRKLIDKDTNQQFFQAPIKTNMKFKNIDPQSIEQGSNTIEIMKGLKYSRKEINQYINENIIFSS